MEQSFTPKNKIIALVLNIIALGAGYLYVGKIRRSLVIVPLLLLSSLFFYYLSTIYSIGYISLFHYIIFLGAYLYTSYDIVKIIKNKEEKSSKYNEVIFIILFIIIYYVVSYSFLSFAPIKKYGVPSSSMNPTIVANDQIIVIKDKQINRGDIIAYWYPPNPKVSFVKRCIAQGGDIVMIKDKVLLLHPKEGDQYIQKNYPKENIVTVDNRLWVKNPYKLEHKEIHNDPKVTVMNTPIRAQAIFDMEPMLIAKNHFFVMGDNRDHSNDSRFWGAVPNEYIIGKVKSIFINFKNLKRSGKKIY